MPTAGHRSVMRTMVAAMAYGLVAMAGLPASAVAARPAPHLEARPRADVTTSLPQGITALHNGAYAYRPAKTGAGPLPLLVLLHGAGGSARRFLETFRGEADRGGYLLLSLQSEAVTWDLIVDAAGKRGGKGEPGFGGDIARSDQLLLDLFRRVAIDPRRIVLAGFSDGASYALSLGLANPKLFHGIIAMSPGFFVAPPAFDPKQRVFITHGRRDEILPFAQARRIADLLETTGVALRFKPFDGPHSVNRTTFAEGMAFAIGPRRPAPAAGRGLE